MGFSTNYEDVQDFGLIPKGEYEIIITKIEEHTTQNGATGMNFTFTIRNDVEQRGRDIMQLAKATRLPKL